MAAHSCVDYADAHARRFWQFESEAAGGKPITVTMRSRIVANNGEAIRDMATAGLGFASLPIILAAQPLREGTLIPALPKATQPPYTISAIYPPTHHVPAKVRTFIDYLLDFFAPSPPWERETDQVGLRRKAKNHQTYPSAEYGRTIFVTQRQGGFIESFRTDREEREHCLQRTES